ncbi:MAG: hypothetical protein ABR582_10230 [Gemmatimonadaceae bacterium]
MTMRFVRSLAFSLGILSAASLDACKKPDPADTLSSVSSELATATIAAEAWVLHRTPNAFTRNELHDARMSVAQQQKTLFTEAVPPVDTTKLRLTLDHAKNVIATLEGLIAKQDAKSFPSVLTLLEQDAKDVKDMSDSLDPSK